MVTKADFRAALEEALYAELYDKEGDEIEYIIDSTIEKLDDKGLFEDSDEEAD